jgi:Fe-S-cluster containining protein
VDHNSLKVHLTRSKCEGCKKCCISIAVDGTDYDMLSNEGKDDRDDTSQCEEDEGTYCEEGDSDTDW